MTQVSNGQLDARVLAEVGRYWSSAAFVWRQLQPEFPGLNPADVCASLGRLLAAATVLHRPGPSLPLFRAATVQPRAQAAAVQPRAPEGTPKKISSPW